MPPNDFGKKFLVEQCQQVRVDDYIRNLKPKLKASLLASELTVAGMRVELLPSRTGFNGKRFWFSCPLCKRRVGVLLKRPASPVLGCRRCLGLRYRKSRYKGMLEASIQKVSHRI